MGRAGGAIVTSALRGALGWETIAPRTAAFAINNPLPAGLNFGLGNDPGDLGWMTSSGVPWKFRYAYLAGGVNTGTGWETWNTPSGQYASYYLTASQANGYLPVFSYYELLQSNPSTGSNESDRDFSNLNNSATISAYYANFTLLMQRAHAFGGALIVHVEPDLWGYLDQRSGGASPATLTASVASSGNVDLAGMPDTAQGFAFALLRLRDRYAPNVSLAIHDSLWATGRDLATDTDPALDPNAVADQSASFLNAAGISSNPYGSTWDLVFNDVADHDAAWYGNTSHWWDRTNVALPNFARWLTYMARLHADTNRPLVVWQVPVGNQYFLTMNNANGHDQDNRAEYFLSHTQDLQAAGIQAVLFGKANAGQTNYTDDTGDGVTNNNGVATSGYQCNACNTHVSQYADDDGGYLRIAVGNYYRTNPAPAPGPGGAYHPLAPSRILDTRTNLGGHLGPLTGGQTYDLTVIGQGGLPASGAVAVVLNVTVTDTSSAGYLTVYPTGIARPGASNLNWRAGQTIPNLVEVKLGTTGKVTIYNFMGTTNVVIDVEGWVGAPTTSAGPDGLFIPLTPARLMDTRNGVGGYSGALCQGYVDHLQVAGRGGVPSTGVEAAVLNVTVTNPTAPSFLTVWPTGSLLPNASNLNFTAGQTIANRVIVKLGATGQVDIYNLQGHTDVVVDVNGWLTDAGGASGTSFVPLAPSRVLDTRAGIGGFSSPVAGGGTIAVQLAGQGGVPPMNASTPPKAVVVNLTVTNTTAGSFMTAWPDGTTRPGTSDLNWVGGITIPDLVVVQVGADGKGELYNLAGSTDVVVDVVGYYQ